MWGKVSSFKTLSHVKERPRNTNNNGTSLRSHSHDAHIKRKVLVFSSHTISVRRIRATHDKALRHDFQLEVP